jgi:hypothetical protein
MIRGVVSHDELPCGVDGMGGEVYLPAMDAVPGRTGRVGGKHAHAIESEHGERQESRPTVGRKRNMDRRKGGEKMVLGGPDGPFRRVGAVLVGWNVLIIGDVLRDEISREGGRGLVVED